MVQRTYGILFFISILYLITLLMKYQKHISIYYTLLSAAIVIVNLGHLQVSGAERLEAALVGNQVVYLASSFLLLFMIAVIADLCKVRIPPAVIALCVTVCCVLLCAMTVGRVPWYYRSVELVQRNGCAFLRKEYGPLHVLYPVYILGIWRWRMYLTRWSASGCTRSSSAMTKRLPSLRILPGSHFDPELCRRFLKCRSKIEALYDHYHD